MKREVYDHINRRQIPPGTQQQQEQERQLQLSQRHNPRQLPPEIANMPNPFQNPQFNNTLPDIPIHDPGAAMLNALLNDDTVPDKIREEFWWVFHRDNVLTFLDEKRKMSKMLNFDILKIDTLNATPYYDYTFEQESKWNAARQMFEVKLDRALGMNGKNERLTIPLTVQENITRTEGAGEGGAVRESFLKRMLNRR